MYKTLNPESLRILPLLTLKEGATELRGDCHHFILFIFLFIF